MKLPNEKEIAGLGSAPEGRGLSFEQIAELAKDHDEHIRYATPEGEASICVYCGSTTLMRAYTNLRDGHSYPVCCSKPDCLDKWEPL
jgi:hypothetical protein